MIQVTNDMKKFFEENAYLSIEQNLFSEHDFNHLKKYLMAFCHALPPEVRPKHFSNNPRLKPYFADWIQAPPILNLVEQFLGPDIVFWSFGVCYKPANSIYRVPAHIDSHYWIDWNLLQPNEVLALFIPFTDVSADNGCLRVIPKMNAPEIYEHRDVDRETNFFFKEISDPRIDFSKMVNVEMKANHVCLLKENLIHSSECNKSAEPRLGITLRYISAATQYKPDPRDSHDLFLLQGQNLARNTLKDLSAYPQLGGFSWSKT